MTTALAAHELPVLDHDPDEWIDHEAWAPTKEEIAAGNRFGTSVDSYYDGPSGVYGVSEDGL